MKRIILGLAAVALGVLAIAPAQAAAPRLAGTVGPGYTIKLTKGGRKVTKLKAGAYTFVISDKSSFHSYGLDGPKGFAKDFTSVPFKGTKTALPSSSGPASTSSTARRTRARCSGSSPLRKSRAVAR